MELDGSQRKPVEIDMEVKMQVHGNRWEVDMEVDGTQRKYI